MCLGLLENHEKIIIPHASFPWLPMATGHSGYKRWYLGRIIIFIHVIIWFWTHAQTMSWDTWELIIHIFVSLDMSYQLALANNWLKLSGFKFSANKPTGVFPAQISLSCGCRLMVIQRIGACVLKFCWLLLPLQQYHKFNSVSIIIIMNLIDNWSKRREHNGTPYIQSCFTVN